MLIKSQYETYFELANRDEKAKEIIYEHLTHLLHNVSKDDAIRKQIRDLIINQSGLWCVIGNFVSFSNELDILDKTE